MIKWIVQNMRNTSTCTISAYGIGTCPIIVGKYYSNSLYLVFPVEARCCKNCSTCYRVCPDTTIKAGQEAININLHIAYWYSNAGTGINRIQHSAVISLRIG